MADAAPAEVEYSDLITRLRELGADEVATEAARVLEAIEEADGGSSPLVAAQAARAFQSMQGAIDRARQQTDATSELVELVRRRLAERASEVGLPDFDAQSLSDLARIDAEVGARSSGGPTVSAVPAAAAAEAPSGQPSPAPPAGERGQETTGPSVPPEGRQAAAAGEPSASPRAGLETALPVPGEPAPVQEGDVPRQPGSAPEAPASGLLTEEQMRVVAQALQVAQAYQRLQELLADDPSTAGRAPGAASDSPVELPEALAPLHEELRGAQANASWYHNAPQWQRIKAVLGAVRDLSDAVTEAPRGYRQEFAQDRREHGFMRTVTARVSRFVGKASGALATGMEKAGMLGTPQWLAARRLEGRAADFSDQLMGRLPKGWTLQTLDDVRRTWGKLRNRSEKTSGAAKDAGKTRQPIAAAAVSRLGTAIAEGARGAGDSVTGTRAWQRLSEMWDAAAPVLSRIHQGVLRFENDAEEMGLLKTAWERTCELASHTARQGMDRLQPKDGNLPSPGWHAMRLVRHVAEENIAHLRGDLAEGQHVRLGTFDHRTASRGIPAPAGPGNGGPRAKRNAASISAAGTPQPISRMVKGKPAQGTGSASPAVTGPGMRRPPAVTSPEAGTGR